MRALAWDEPLVWVTWKDRVGNVGVTARLLHPSFPSDLAKLPVRENNGSSVAPRSQGCGAPD